MRPAVLGAAAALLLCVWAPSAPAQPTPVPAQPTSAAAQPETADTPSPRRIELARELMAATRVDSMMSGMMHDMIVRLAASNRNLKPDAQAQTRIIEQAEERMFADLTPRIVGIMQDAYARSFSEEELSGLVAFYQSPVGRAAIAKMPLVMQSVTGQVLALMPRVRREMGEEICAKTACTPAQKAAFFGTPPAKD